MKRVLLSLSVIAFCALGPWLRGGETSAPFLFSSFQPAPDTILARSAIGTLTEQEFCVYLLLNEEIAPDLYFRYREEQNLGNKAVLEDQIREAIEEYFVMRALARQSQQVQSLSAADQRHLRMQKYPIYEWVWVDRYVRNTFTVRPEDIKKYYNSHRDEFMQPKELTVRYVFVAVPEEKAGLGREDARRRLERIRDSVHAGRDFAVAVHDVLPDVHVSAYTLREGMRSTRFPETFQLEAFKLQPGDLSSVLETADGLYLIECIDQREETPIALEPVSEKIRNRLNPQILKYQYQYMLNKLRERWHPENRAHWLGKLHDNSPVIRVRRFVLTKANLLVDYSAHGENAVNLESKQAVEICEDLMNKELISQACENLKLYTDERLEFADTICRAMVAADRTREKYAASRQTVTPEQEREYFEQNPDLFHVEPIYRIYRISGMLNHTQLQHDKITDQEKNLIRAKLQECMEILRKRWNIAVSESIAPAQSAHPVQGSHTNLTGEAVTQLLEQQSTETIKFQCEELRYVPTAKPGPLDSWLRNLRPGEFSAIGETGNTLFVFFVAAYQPAKQMDFESIQPAIHALLLHSARTQALATLRNTTLDYLKIQYAF